MEAVMYRSYEYSGWAIVSTMVVTVVGMGGLLVLTENALIAGIGGMLGGNGFLSLLMRKK
jgi:hypothetical protein